MLLVAYVFWGLLAMPLPWEFQRAGFAVQLLTCKSRHLIYFRLASQCWCGGSRPPTLVHPDSDHVSCWSLLALPVNCQDLCMPHLMCGLQLGFPG